jgi:hypothetical protein
MNEVNLILPSSRGRKMTSPDRNPAKACFKACCPNINESLSFEVHNETIEPLTTIGHSTRTLPIALTAT